MTPLPEHPLVHEIFTWVWLADLEVRLGRQLTLADVPPEVWDEVAGPGVDAVWLMGVWQRSPMGAAVARQHPAMAEAQRRALPDLTDADVVGSAYCIRDYTVDARLGGEDGLAAARCALADRGVGLVLDFVPNHVAPDHRWTRESPEYFVLGTADDLAADPASFLAVGDHVIARGRDPYFPAWPEVVQLDTARSDVRAAAAATLASIAGRCDAIRCDMAMLVLDDVHLTTWSGRAASPADGRGYWPTVFETVRTEHPHVRFWAEAYWGREPDLVDQGFDACYDKQLYDLLAHGAGAPAVRGHLGGDFAGSSRTVRFTENHDEPRIRSTLASPADRAATVIALTAPGVALLHEGQQVGRTVHVPVTLGRRPDEPADDALSSWYRALLDGLGGGMRRGEWRPLSVEGWPDNRSAEHLVAWAWSGDGDWLVVVNLDDGRADGMLRTDLLGDGPVVLDDRLSGEAYPRERIADAGLYVALDGHGAHVFEARPVPGTGQRDEPPPAGT